MQSPLTRLFEVKDGVVKMNDRVSFPAMPMVGVVGVATGGEKLSNGLAGRHGGNLDDHWHGKGARIFFPVRQPGGMFAVGDMHAAMGDGEICFTGVEIAGEVDIRFDLLKGKQATWPVTELADRWLPHATAPEYGEALAARLRGGGAPARRRARLHDRGRVHLPLGRLRRRGRAGVQALRRASARSPASRSRRSTPARRRSASRRRAYNPVMAVRTMNPVHVASTCAVAATAEIIGAKWTALLVHDLSEGPRRFSELERSCQGISPRTLAERLRALEAEGILERQSYPETPPRVEYSLTAKGESLLPIIDAMREFGHEWLPCGRRTRTRSSG